MKVAPTPKIGPGGLVTVAYLKARLDQGEDQLGIFMPLALDVLPELPNYYFTASEVQEAIASRHGVSMPQETISTLLKRATKSRILLRDVGRYQINPGKLYVRPKVSDSKEAARRSQIEIGQELLEQMNRRGLACSDVDGALELIVGFLEQQQVSVLLGVPSETDTADLSRAETAAVAEFLRDVMAAESALSRALDDILQGLVLYHASFLPDLAEVSRKFENLTVVFDTVLVRQALGYEGTAPRGMIRETLGLLAASSVRCVVFETTVQEIHRILWMYQDKLATAEGRRSLRPSPMARHFLTQHYAPSDVQEMSALLRDEIRQAGFTILRTPDHLAKFTHDEVRLAGRLADPRTGDVTEPRIEHDVDCVAGVLTLRAGHRSSRVEDARVLFATVSPLVIRNTRLWWEEDERESGVPPIVHLRALANFAWLKRPSAGQNLQTLDLIALCAAAMRPSARTWKRFMTHLEGLNRTNRLSPDQLTAVIVSTLSDQLLHDLEAEHGNSDDVDAGTLDEVVDRVIAQYSADADQRLRDLTTAYDQRISSVEAGAAARAASAEANAQNAAEILRRRELALDNRARGWAYGVARAAYWTFVILVVLASAALAIRTLLDSQWPGLAFAVAILILTGLETAGALDQLRSGRVKLEASLTRRFRRLLGANDDRVGT